VKQPRVLHQPCRREKRQRCVEGDAEEHGEGPQRVEIVAPVAAW
jgi:hypothetical protein